jgi:small ligand-binding sensory domain FIST
MRALGRLDGATPDVAFLFVSPAYGDGIGRGGRRLRKATGARHVLGCTGAGVCETDGELENGPVLSLLLASLPGAELRSFRIRNNELEGLRDAPQVCQRVGADPSSGPWFVVLTDPFTLDTDDLLRRLGDAYPLSPVVGGLASGGTRPGLHQLYADDFAPRAGGVGLAVTGAPIRPIVSQGCRPVGRRFIVTRCRNNAIQRLSGRPALEAIQDAVAAFSPGDRHLARTSLLLGRVSHEAQDDFGRGDFLIRPIVGADADEGSVVVADRMRVGQTVQLQLRDHDTATEDLNLALAEVVASGPPPRGALLFSCAGRGTNLFHAPDHDVQAVRRHAGDIPLSGFFCNGEIGTVAGRSFVHGFTASVALF